MKKYKHTSIKKVLSALIMSCCILNAMAQDGDFETNDKVIMRSTIFGVGYANVLDTYLSSYNYTGGNIDFIYESMHTREYKLGEAFSQTMVELNLAKTDNRAGTATDYSGGMTVASYFQHIFKINDKLKLAAGPGASFYAGCVYNDRNGNNPAQAKLNFMVDVSAQAFYNIRVLKKNMQLRYEVIVPLLGVAYSPEYGQSYYEQFILGDHSNTVKFANMFNMPSAKNMLTLNIPFYDSVLRVGVLGNYQQSRFNSIKYHSYTTSIIFGYSKYLNFVKPSKNSPLPF